MADIFSEFPVLELKRIVLRAGTYDDAQDYLDYISHKEVHRYIPDECLPKTLEQAQEEIDYMSDLFKYGRSIYWIIADKKTNKLIGSCGFNYWNKDHRRGEISYDLKHSYWGKGIMTEAIEAVITFGFVNMKLHRIEATVTEMNLASKAVLKKHKFKKEGVLRQQKLLHGKFYDAIMLSLLSHEYLTF